jgi:hypothetical protein
MSKNENADWQEINQFLQWYRENTNENAVVSENKKQYDKIQSAITTIKEFVEKITPDAEILVRQDKIDKTALFLRVTAKEFIFEDLTNFCKALLTGTNVEFYPVKGRKIVMAIRFGDAYSVD